MSLIDETKAYLRGKQVILDANVFLIYLIGNIDPNRIEKFRRTTAFTAQEYYLLKDILVMSNIVVTPNILTEVSNLIENKENQLGVNLLAALRDLIKENEEHYYKSQELMLGSVYLKCGLADSSISNMCRMGAVAITLDLTLHHYILNLGYSSFNFNNAIS